MPATLAGRLTAILDDYLPTPARLLLTLVVLALGLCVAGLGRRRRGHHAR